MDSAHPQLPAASAAQWVDEWHADDISATLREIVMVGPQIVERVAQRMGMSARDVEAMEHLMEEPLGSAALARRLSITPAAASMLIDRLEARGHVRRVRDEEDGRRKHVIVTDSGREDVFSQLLPMFVGIEAAAAALSDGERAVVQKYLDGVLEACRRLL